MRGAALAPAGSGRLEWASPNDGGHWLGTSHGASGVLYALLAFAPSAVLDDADARATVEATLDHMLEMQLPSGNFPVRRRRAPYFHVKTNSHYKTNIKYKCQGKRESEGVSESSSATRERVRRCSTAVSHHKEFVRIADTRWRGPTASEPNCCLPIPNANTKFNLKSISEMVLWQISIMRVREYDPCCRDGQVFVGHESQPVDVS